jgi:hypothetical protein
MQLNGTQVLKLNASSNNLLHRSANTVKENTVTQLIVKPTYYISWKHFEGEEVHDLNTRWKGALVPTG